MFALTDDDYTDDEREAEAMDDRRLRFPPVSPAVKALAERLMKLPPIDWTAPMNEMDKAVARAEQARLAQTGGR